MSQSKQQTNEYISLIARHQTAIYAFVRSMVTNAADAQDIAQETNIALWSSMGRFKPGTDFYAYATHIAYRKVCGHSRRNKRHSLLVFDSELTEKIASTIGQIGSRNAEKRASALEGCIGKLNEDDRSLMEQLYGERRSVRDIASGISRSESALQNAFSKIRAKLRLCILQTLSEP